MNTLDDLIETLLNTRDLSADENGALRDWEDENWQLRAAQRVFVLNAVESRWNYWRKAAGVTKPISTHERAAINESFDDALIRQRNNSWQAKAFLQEAGLKRGDA